MPRRTVPLRQPGPSSLSLIDAMSRIQETVGFIFWLGFCFSAAAVGAFASANAGDFYQALVRPDWAPPGWLFGPV